ncbi:hypothetical protein HYW83_01800 [Candidatus Peregrinibacteria bacterium]|nr:hypothetical protein [Candidatus Peregrinibacteria bacterium]
MDQASETPPPQQPRVQPTLKDLDAAVRTAAVAFIRKLEIGTRPLSEDAEPMPRIPFNPVTIGMAVQAHFERYGVVPDPEDPVDYQRIVAGLLLSRYAEMPTA